MNSSRLSKLSALTRGAAVIGLGLAATACTKQGDEPPHINAPAPQDKAPEPTNEGDASVPVRRFPIPNAMPPRFDDADAATAPKK
jgi:hypothetical protein